MALGNQNYVLKRGDDDPHDAMDHDEQEIKLGSEAMKKNNQEHLQKVKTEGTNKRIKVEQAKLKMEEKVF